jgi:hypothetical protein
MVRPAWSVPVSFTPSLVKTRCRVCPCQALLESRENAFHNGICALFVGAVLGFRCFQNRSPVFSLSGERDALLRKKVLIRKRESFCKSNPSPVAKSELRQRPKVCVILGLRRRYQNRYLKQTRKLSAFLSLAVCVSKHIHSICFTIVSLFEAGRRQIVPSKK